MKRITRNRRLTSEEAAKYKAIREQVADECDRFRLGHGQDEHVAGLERRHCGVHHQVVALAAENSSRRTGRLAARHRLDEVHIDDAAACRLRNGGSAQPRQPLGHIHRPVTT